MSADYQTKPKYTFKSGGNPAHIAEELKSRKLYNETRGTQFASDTVVVRNRPTQSGREAVQEPQSDNLSRVLTNGGQKKSGSQNTMGMLSGSSSKTSRSGGGGIFEKLMRDAQTDPSAPSSSPKGTSAWMKGMNSNIPADKRGALERQLKWMAKVESGAPSSDSQPHPTQQLHLAQPQQQYAPPQQTQGGNFGQPMSPMGQLVNGILSDPVQAVAAPAANNDTLKASMILPANRDIFNSVRLRIANLLLNDLPPQVTSELRQMAKELEQLNSSINQPVA
jgi:hypothetical protein